MSEKKSFSVKFNEAQKDFANQVLGKAVELFETDTKGDTLYALLDDWNKLTSDKEAITKDFVAVPDMLEDLCELGFLQKIVDPNENVLLWHCLKNQRPDGKGKPIIMADGRDRQSITKLCEACKQGFVWHEQRSKLGKTMAAIQRFGDMELSVEVNSCIHPANNAIQVNLGVSGNFYCKLKEDRVTLQRTCKPNACEYLHRASAPIFMKETAAFKEVTKQLTEPGA